MARPKDPELEARRKDEILAAVTELLTAGSWRSMTLSAVAERAGVSKGVVTYWFPSKDALITGAITRFHEAYTERLMAIVAEPAPPRLRLERLVEAALPSQQIVADEVRFQAEVWSYAKDHPEIEEWIATGYVGFRAACEGLLLMGQAEGYVTADPEGLYLYIHALIDGLTLHLAYDPDADVASARTRLLELLDRWLIEPPSG